MNVLFVKLVEDSSHRVSLCCVSPLLGICQLTQQTVDPRRPISSTTFLLRRYLILIRYVFHNAVWYFQLVTILSAAPVRQRLQQHVMTFVGFSHKLLRLHRIWLFQIRPKPNFGTQIRPEPKPNLAETSFLVTEQYASDKTNGVNNAVSRYRGSTLQCFLCCVTVCQLLIKFVE